MHTNGAWSFLELFAIGVLGTLTVRDVVRSGEFGTEVSDRMLTASESLSDDGLCFLRENAFVNGFFSWQDT